MTFARFFAGAALALALTAPVSAQTLIPVHVATTPTDTGALSAWYTTVDYAKAHPDITT